ncbi:T9SS type A sorting domain-containing protein [Chitinophaga agri]|uniref:T9SS type A sorting domain-containing protein n=1 Tax=Chitinophaga agri TaxID=2703787 RepID=A0A6B9ZGI2_9BACT|nr:T9SS type A sorting domain-containing protein [Chitinophaga agri]QHS59693.1 T9SS type A sorting domain-containing protein [Chitinophaga agri]
MMKTLLFLTLFLCQTTLANASNKPAARWSVNACSVTIDCGDNALLIATVSAAERRYTLTWSTGQRAPVIKVAHSGRYTVTLKDSKGMIRARDTVVITLQNPVEASIKVRRSPSGDTLVAYPQYKYLPIYKYRWYRNDTLLRVSSPVYPRPVSGVYKVEVTGLMGCRDISAPLVYQKPDALTVDFSYTQGGCSGEELAFLPIVNTTDSIISYQWNFGDQQTSTVRDPVHQFIEGTYTVSLAVTTLGGLTDTVSRQVTIPPVPRWEVSIKQTPNACGDAVTLQVITSPEVDIIEWNGLPGPASITVDKSGKYTAFVYDSCFQFRGAAEVDVTVTPAFYAEIRRIPGVEGPDTLVAAVAGGEAFPTGIPPAGYFFTWYRYGAVVSAPEPWITPAVAGDYKVLIETPAGCSSLSGGYYYSPANAFRLGNLPPQNEPGATLSGVSIQAYPNPSSGQVYLKFDKPLDKQVTVQVLDMQGRIRYVRTTQQQLQLLDLSGSLPGQYFVRITGDGMQRILPLIIQ